MDRKAKILLIIFVLLLIWMVGATFYKYEIKKDYLIVAQAPCNSETESCFYMPCDGSDSTCDPASPEYYKKVEKKAFNIKLCDPAVDGCNPLVCSATEKDCSVTFCSADNLVDGEECSTSAQE